MLDLIFRFTALLLIASMSSTLCAQEAPAPDREVPYVSVSFEVNGLAESADLLHEAMRQLSETLADIAASPEDLTPEQLAAFTALAVQTNELVISLERTLKGVGPAIRDAETPTREVLVSLLDTAKTQAIDPTLESIDKRVRTWLVLTVVGVLLIVGIAGLGLYLSTRQLRTMASLLRSLGDEYRVVPRALLAGAEPAGPLPDVPEDPPADDESWQ